MAKEFRSADDEEVAKKSHEQDIPDDGMPRMDRRHFLGTLGAVGGAALLGEPKSSFASEEFEGWPNRYGMLVDTTLCVGCRSCEKACNSWNHLPRPDVPFDEKSVFEETRRTTEKAYIVVNRFRNPKDERTPIYRTLNCMHCNEPACATSCPIHAYSKTPEGAVRYNADLCFGCRYCMTACPFYIPAFDYWSALEPKIVKCTFCYDRITKGQRTACSEACPTGALTFGRRDDLIKLARKTIEENPDKYIDHIYGETEAGGTTFMYLSAVPFDQLGLPTNIPHKPLIEETKGFLSAVPVVLTVWPALFTMVYAGVRHRDKFNEKEFRKHAGEEEKK
jgi:formate dehydrogenase iron-sulfur subunit